MANKWIISDYNFMQHKTLESAQQELKRLNEAYPKKKFKIYRCKTSLEATDSSAIIERLRGELERATKAALYFSQYAHGEVTEEHVQWAQEKAKELGLMRETA